VLGFLISDIFILPQLLYFIYENFKVKRNYAYQFWLGAAAE